MPKNNTEQLIEVWKVLDVLTVSLDRLGHYQRIHGEAAAQVALSRFMGPAMLQRIAEARTSVVSVLESADPKMRRKLERIAESVDYWDGPEP